MKNYKSLFLVLALLVSTIAFAQKEYNPWSVDVGFGNHTVNDPSYTTNNSMHINSHWNVGARYNFSPTFALGIRAAIDNFEGWSEDLILSPSVPIDSRYYRVSIEAIIDIFDVVDIHSDLFTMLIHGGLGSAIIDVESTGHNEKMGMFTGGVTGIFKINNNLGIKLDYSITSHIDQKYSLDGQFPSNAEGMSSNVHNGSIGIIAYFGDGDKKPADFYEKPTCNIIHQSDTTIVNNYKTEVTERITIVQAYDPVLQEFVFFAHDKEKVRKSELNAIYQTYNSLEWFSDKKVKIIGWASDTSSTPEYNQALSERRCQEIKLKLLDMGISEYRISIDPSGKDYHLDKENVHDLARRVELRIVD
jgi:outer membrane protein OmpA-like peptidoglycan-associated protein